MKILNIAVFLLFSLIISGQDTWGTLSMVTFETKYDPAFGIDLQIPSFSPILMNFDGKEITVSGYFIPLNGKAAQSHFMLSKFPQSTCFFCGKAGPETAMQVFMKDGKKQKYEDEKITLKGTLRINTTDPTALLYTLENAVNN